MNSKKRKDSFRPKRRNFFSLKEKKGFDPDREDLFRRLLLINSGITNVREKRKEMVDLNQTDLFRPNPKDFLSIDRMRNSMLDLDEESEQQEEEKKKKKKLKKFNWIYWLNFIPPKKKKNQNQNRNRNRNRKNQMIRA